MSHCSSIILGQRRAVWVKPFPGCVRVGQMTLGAGVPSLSVFQSIPGIYSIGSNSFQGVKLHALAIAIVPYELDQVTDSVAIRGVWHRYL